MVQTRAFVELCERSAWNLPVTLRNKSLLIHVYYLYQTSINKQAMYLDKYHEIRPSWVDSLHMKSRLTIAREAIGAPRAPGAWPFGNDILWGLQFCPRLAEAAACLDQCDG